MAPCCSQDHKYIHIWYHCQIIPHWLELAWPWERHFLHNCKQKALTLTYERFSELRLCWKVYTCSFCYFGSTEIHCFRPSMLSPNDATFLHPTSQSFPPRWVWVPSQVLLTPPPKDKQLKPTWVTYWLWPKAHYPAVFIQVKHDLTRFRKIILNVYLYCLSDCSLLSNKLQDDVAFFPLVNCWSCIAEKKQDALFRDLRAN